MVLAYHVMIMKSNLHQVLENVSNQHVVIFNLLEQTVAVLIVSHIKSHQMIINHAFLFLKHVKKDK